MLELDVSAPRVVDGKYELIELLGLGSMGEVWLARHLALGQTCALKLIARDTHEAPAAALQRFTREARIAAGLSRKTRHIVSVTDFGSDEEGAYLVMELLGGEPLDSRLARPISPSDVSAIVSQIAKALGVAHREGILHRDLKPANVFLGRAEDGGLLVKLLDFGIARLMVGSTKALTADGVVVGSPAYMSPEQALGESLDARADVWSLAVVAYECLTDVLPFPGESTASMLRRIMDVEPTPLRTICPKATPSLEAFFSRAFARRIEDRFQTATELAIAFASAITPAPIRRDRVRWAILAAVCSAAIGAGAMLVARSSSSSVPRVAEVRVLTESAVASAQVPLVETQIESPRPPPPTTRPKDRPVAKPKPIVDPSSIF